jgi:hypothetical protein
MYGQIRKFYMIGDLRWDNGQYFVIEQGTLDDYLLSEQLAFCSSRDRNGLLSELPVLWNAPVLVAQSSVKTPALQSIDKLSGQWGSRITPSLRSLDKLNQHLHISPRSHFSGSFRPQLLVP